MVVYNFKKIQAVPPGQAFIDIVLTRTQRKTPTVVHPGYSIGRIRKFYMRKVKYTAETINEKLSQILNDFPQLDDIHPFYADLMNILYDKDHYKLALGQLNTARRLVDNIAKDYVRLLKFGDSLYRCKQLKRAGLGRMMKVLKKNGPSLGYLEEVRQHLARLPSIDPNTRTVIICGYPNVGKSSFLNKVTRADVDVQPYAFTTKSLFVGHMDYNHLRWQVIDTPGILDHPLEERNTIEMQSITALAHLRASILYFVDISEQCGYTIEEQCKLFETIKPLFAGKPLIVVMNKIDVIRPDDLKEEDKRRIESMIISKGGSDNTVLLTMSTHSEEGVVNVKQAACDALLQQRVQTRLRGKHVDDVVNRLHLSVPAPRDEKERPSMDPIKLSEEEREVARSRMAEWQKQQELYLAMDPDHTGIDFRMRYDLENPDWRTDVIPEIMDGKNVFDYWSADIEERMDALEKEEFARLRRIALDESNKEEEMKLTPQQMEKVLKIRQKRALVIQQSRLKKGTDQPRLPSKYNIKGRDMTDFSDHLKALGLDGEEVTSRIRARSHSRARSSLGASPSRARAASADSVSRMGRKRKREESVARGMSTSRTPAQSGLKNDKQQALAFRLAKRARLEMSRDGRAGESDRHVYDNKPKHLFSGKMTSGKKDRR
eukprot:TRINITY_DN2553_c0_g4_i1.p2 TRINITY_DN2553_c0_g4~~TRINITY_DN2553_c0_g4_i1.p2  ORF type:complete len:659 (+),score=156.84 TRINITY_DN2553_c0_g4_i1:2210-4186(+)